MISKVELSSIDLRYKEYRMKNPGVESKLLASIAENGVREPLEGIDTKNKCRILLNGFKRYRCAKKLNIGIVPYTALGEDEAMGIIQLIRLSNTRSLNILEQAKLLDHLRDVYKMSVTEIAGHLSMSKAWVSVRLGLIGGMSKNVRDKIFSGAFPVYSYMYTLRQFIRINKGGKEDIDKFVNAVAGKKLSIRNIEQLAYGYFRGPEEFREQIKNGNILWGLETMKQGSSESDDCNEFERGMLRDLEITQKYMQRVMYKSRDSRFKNNSFYAQANLLSGGILSKIKLFSKILEEFHDRSRQT